MNLLNIAMRAAGRLLADGRITREIATALIRHTWARVSGEVMPFGETSNRTALDQLTAAGGNDHWCEFCEDIPHRVQAAGTRCPSCLDRERRGAA